ncbi:hypothetical protein [Rufibacter psychrotolerans]|uniref:hypothetical protein n=1 Tax=Rufibacter psychrotolerans TaxID=2812556 RepID=UPI00196708B3|nr:hypothetical protein [Rufibacter sp. SYSU D00308]
MKKLSPLVLALALVLPAQAQKLLSDFYAIGFVDDFGGRKWVKADPVEMVVVDRFHTTETGLVQFLNKVIELENKRTFDKVATSLENWETQNCYYCHEFKRLHSKRLTEKINDAFTFKGGREEDAKGNKILVGTLREKAFKTLEEKASFLAGAYVRYGFQAGGKYGIRLTKSLSKFDAVVRELKTLGCEVHEVTQAAEGSASQLVTFTPSKELRPYLDQQEKLRQSIAAKKEQFSREKQSKVVEFFTISGN